MALAGENPEPDGQLLHDIENGDQEKLQKKEPVAPLHAALSSRDNATDIGVGQHDDEARADDGEEDLPIGHGRPITSLAGGSEGHSRDFGLHEWASASGDNLPYR